MLFPEADHENEIYHPDRQDSTHTISRRMSMYFRFGGVSVESIFLPLHVVCVRRALR